MPISIDIFDRRVIEPISLIAHNSVCSAWRRIAGAPSFETFFTIGEQGGVVGEIKLEAIFSRGVVFAKIVVVGPADGGSVLVDTAATVGFEMGADCVEHHEPAIVVLVDADTFMRNLPQ